MDILKTITQYKVHAQVVKDIAARPYRLPHAELCVESPDFNLELVAGLQARVPIVALAEPVVGGPFVLKADQANALEALEAILHRQVEPQR